jgi:F-box-like
MLTTISQGLTLNTETKHKSRAKKKFNLTGLPNEILLNIFDYLNVFDSATLALTCKHLAGIASTYSHLDMPVEKDNPRRLGWQPYEEGHFLKKRLGDRFFSNRLRYCWGCKHYVPRRKSHWKKHLGKRTWEGNYRTSKNWDFNRWWESNPTEQMLTQWNKGNALKCPRCKLYKALAIPIL